MPKKYDWQKESIAGLQNFAKQEGTFAVLVIRCGEFKSMLRAGVAGDDEARASGDGITLDERSISGPARWMAGHYFNPRSRMLGLGAGSAAKQGREQIRSAGAVALFTAPRAGETSWLVAGQAYERLALRATGLGIAHQPIQAPLQRAPYRTDLVRQFGAVGEEPLMLVRLGHAKPPEATPRRGVPLVATFRMS